MLPDPIQDLISAFERLPGIGPKTASRLAFYLLRAPEEVSASLAAALADLKPGASVSVFAARPQTVLAQAAPPARYERLTSEGRS